jgi:hypothetical protein
MHTSDSVFKAFQRALEFGKRLPDAGPTGYASPWPEIVRLGHEGYSSNRQTVFSLTAAELKEYETTVSWMAFLKQESDRRILWAAASGMQGYRIAKLCRPVVSQSTISRRVMWALGFIAYKLNDGELPPGFAIQPQQHASPSELAMGSPWDVLRKPERSAEL